MAEKEFALQSFPRICKPDDSVALHNFNGGWIDGMLHLSFPKQEKAKRVSKTIDVQ